MNDIEKMAKIISDRSNLLSSYDIRETSPALIYATALVNAGYGDVKQALEDYATKLHNNIVVYLKRDFDTREEVCKIIDETLKEVCGE